MLPALSIVIPCFNEESRIGQTLRLTLDYLAANAPESELIVVNDGSTDATGTIAGERLSRHRSPRVCWRIFQIAGRAPRCAPGCWLREHRSGFFPTPIFPRRLKRHRS
ncbi:MAG: hypothetical protein DMF26_14250 [Verrucomicrobia bacterium]|nr:MAG: hypothetical protein DMF26_14250 [Verrucomicrobiota bacterium]